MPTREGNILYNTIDKDYQKLSVHLRFNYMQKRKLKAVANYYNDTYANVVDCALDMLIHTNSGLASYLCTYYDDREQQCENQKVKYAASGTKPVLDFLIKRNIITTSLADSDR